MFTDADVGPRLVDGRKVELSDDEKRALVEIWNAEQARRATPLPYREARSLAYRDELGKEQGDYIKTLGDVLDVLIAQVEDMRRAGDHPATQDFGELLTRVAAIKARHPNQEAR